MWSATEIKTFNIWILSSHSLWFVMCPSVWRLVRSTVTRRRSGSWASCGSTPTPTSTRRWPRPPETSTGSPCPTSSTSCTQRSVLRRDACLFQSVSSHHADRVLNVVPSSPGSRLAKLLLDQAVCLGQRSRLHRIERRGSRGAVGFWADLESLRRERQRRSTFKRVHLTV